jgi:hypothetical protein|tara:strand:- start:63 stop:467 length:405 start_codon:yes stop_codon:yes gene_type:complete
MKEQLITFDTAKLAKEKGFENKTPHKLRRDYYNHLGEINGDVTEYIKAYVANKGLEKYNTIDAPTQSLLQKWLREEHKINVESNYLPNIQKYSCLYIPMRGKACISDRKYVSKLKFDTYEEALEEGLQEALKLI